MKSISLCVILWLVTVSQMVAQPKFDKAEVKSWMKRVADWQIANPNKEAEHDDLDWTHAALYMGMIDWAELTERKTLTVLTINGYSVLVGRIIFK